MTTPVPSSAPGDRIGRYGLALLWVALVALALPSLTVGPVNDDWWHAADSHADASWGTRLLTLYDFFSSDEVAAGKASGLLPWWSDDALSIRFFRPLSSLVLSIDHWLLDGGGLWSHAHSLVWFALTLYAAHRVFRLLFDAGAARWMTPLYGVFSCHLLPLAFVAARHSHVSAALSFAAFECLIRALTERRRGFEVAACGLFVLALLGGESAVTIVPIALAFAVAEGGWRRGLWLLAPELVVLIAFAAAYRLWGFGAANSAAYLTPGSVDFFVALPGRFLALAGNLLSGFPADVWLFGAEAVLVAVGGVALVAAGLGWRVLWGVLAPVPRRRVTALCLGALVSLVPLSAGIPGGRLLIIPSLAAAPLFAFAALEAVRRFRVERGRGLLLGAWVLCFGIGVGPIFRLVIPIELARVSRELPAAARAITEHCSGRTALVVGTPDPNVAYFPVLLLLAEEPRPTAFHILSMAPGKHHLEGIEAGRYELTIAGDFMALPWPRIYRNSPIVEGHSEQLEGLELHVMEANPTALRLALRTTAPSCWLTLERGALVTLEPPGPGAESAWTPSPRPM